MAPYYQPVRALIFPDLVALFIPRLKDTLDQIFTLVEKGEYDVATTAWCLHTWAGERHALVLEIDHHGLEFNIAFMPNTWDQLVPAMMQAKTVGIITERQYFNEEQGTVEAFYLDDNNTLRRTMYKVFRVDTGLIKMVEQLKELQQTWDPKGLVTYLLHTLGEPLENPTDNPSTFE